MTESGDAATTSTYITATTGEWSSVLKASGFSYSKESEAERLSVSVRLHLHVETTKDPILGGFSIQVNELNSAART